MNMQQFYISLKREVQKKNIAYTSGPQTFFMSRNPQLKGDGQDSPVPPQAKAEQGAEEKEGGSGGGGGSGGACSVHSPAPTPGTTEPLQ